MTARVRGLVCVGDLTIRGDDDVGDDDLDGDLVGGDGDLALEDDDGADIVSFSLPGLTIYGSRKKIPTGSHWETRPTHSA